MAGDVGNNPILLDFLENLNIDAFNFIPTLSSLAITSTNDWYATVSESDIDIFEAYFIPEENEIHVSLTQESIDYAREEIFLELLSTNDLNKDLIRLEKNPVRSKLVLFGSLNDAEVQIYDLTGKLIYSENQTLENRTEIKVNASTGLYILSVSNENVNQKIKFIVR